MAAMTSRAIETASGSSVAAERTAPGLWLVRTIWMRALRVLMNRNTPLPRVPGLAAGVDA